MKSIFVLFAAAMLFVSSAGAISLDKDSAKVKYIGYKTVNKIAAPGIFKDVEFEFVKLEGEITDILTGAKAKVDFNKIDTIKNPVRDNNIRTKLVAHMKTPNIIVEFKEIKGDNKSGDIKAEVNMNEVIKEIPMKYEIKNGVLQAMGNISMTDFMPEAFDKFQNDKIIQGLHGKKTFAEVDITFEADVK